MREKLLIRRELSAIGDWLMTATVIKMINNQFPDLDIYVYIKAKSNFYTHNNYVLLPKLILEILNNFNIKIKEFVTFFDIRSFDYDSGNLVYKKIDNINFIESMVNTFNENTGLNLKYEPETFAVNTQLKNLPILTKPYILTHSESKNKYDYKNGKEYGFFNMVKLTEKLKNQFEVVQIGSINDRELPVEHIFLGKDLKTLHNLMINSLCFIGINGALGVYASFHKVPNYIIYTQNYDKNWTKTFPCRIRLNCENINTEKLGEKLITNIKTNINL